MGFPECFQQCVKRDPGRVKHHQHNFRVPGLPGAYFLIGGVGRIAARIANGSDMHAVQLPELALSAPEAAKPELHLLQALRIWTLECCTVHKVGVSGGKLKITARQRCVRGNHLSLFAPKHRVYLLLAKYRYA